MSNEWSGVFTAIITPFQRDGKIDWSALERIVEMQIGGGVAGIVPCGTTGEAPTLEDSESEQVIRAVVKQVRGRCKVIAGTGSNSTAKTIRNSLAAMDGGADGCLIVNPYYNKPTQEGLFRHFVAVANALRSAPWILYNIKGRTAVNVETGTVERIAAAAPNLIAIKEASGDLVQIQEVIKAVGRNIAVLSGDDALTTDILKLGGKGVVSVASNLIPGRIVEIVEKALSGDLANAEKQSLVLKPLYQALFIETNPIPIKAAMAIKGWCEEQYRLPLCEMSAENRRHLVEVLSSF